MKQLKYIFSILSIAILLSACNSDLAPEYQYENNPQYTWGYQLFYGDYYDNYGVTNNVSSLILFTNGLSVDSLGYLTGIGQYLVLYDMFTPITDTILTEGKYTISDSSEPFTVKPGQVFNNIGVPGRDIVVGASINYLDVEFAKTKFIIDGFLDIKVDIDGKCSITCNFTTSDGMELKGDFAISNLPFIDMSLKKEIYFNKTIFISKEKVMM